ncbi:UvrD-helicase domain-containing protein [Urechidicola croceus]|uniref:DNA 3'-5' helicase n=1 Tax=Urechidicola croceus TaxID=1850246 RepID=A0A1D8P9E3_9FLAO|nr:UvrD-helicase domain-containing protein [Urechidicola croceus]AOW21202.1 DNA helicase UvrD [Urechidicola croceus]
MQESNQFQVYNASAGSGKTFTLVKEYLKILLSSNDRFRFQNILAITFTNKASAEMKDRVISNLKSFSEGKPNHMSSILLDEIDISSEILQKRSKNILDSILQNYSAFNITTIDSFTHRIIRNFAFDLGLSLNFDVEMDVNLLLEEAVDLLISKIGEDKDLTRVLIEFSLDKTENDKSWDISRDLKEFAQILLNENDVSQLKKLENKTVQDFTELKKKLKKQQKEIENQFVKIGENGLEIISSMNLEHNDFYYSMLPKHFLYLSQNFEKVGFFDQNKLRDRIKENTFYSKNKSEDVKAAIESILPTLLDLYNQSEKLYQQYILNNLVLKSLIPLSVLKHINSSLNEIKQQNNIRLNAEFNQIISEQIKNEPAPFIYERIGEKFKYFFIDEMQDTSKLQWQNLIPLIENSLTSETIEGDRGSLMLVGDAKQAIYRWRGGKAEQFIELADSNGNNPFSISKSIKNLDVNYRSFSQIIEFNNDFFTFISNAFGNENYKELYVSGNKQLKNQKDGGFVQISFVEKDKEDDEKDLLFPKKVLKTIQNLDSNFKLSDVCVLVRRKKDGIAIADFLSENKIDIISSETLLLKNNTIVTFIIDTLTFLQFPENDNSKAKALYFLSQKLNLKLETHDFIHSLVSKSNKEIFEMLKGYGFDFDEKIVVQFSFYESIEYIIKSFQLISESDAFVSSFLDFVLEYQQNRGNGLSDFLEYWERKKESLSIAIPDGQNAVKIMTIHKSKGLEFPVVIFPYDLDIYFQQNAKVWYDKFENEEMVNFQNSLLDYSKKLNYIGGHGEYLHNKTKEEMQLDNINLLYVVLTRPIEQLYIISEKKVKNNSLENAKYYSDFFIDFLRSLSEENSWSDTQNEYKFGSSKRVLIENNLKIKLETSNQKKFVSTSWKEHKISIVASSSILWDTEQEQAIKYGNLIHEIMSKIRTVEDIETTIQQYVFDGFLDVHIAGEITKKIFNLVKHPFLKKYYQKGCEIFNEQEIISKNKIRQIPDRIVFFGNNVTIIDYKTGRPDIKYQQQLISYSDTLKEMGFNIEKCILIYLDSEIKIESVI